MGVVSLQVVYFYQGHQLYRDAVFKTEVYPWKHQLMPWEEFTLRVSPVEDRKMVASKDRGNIGRE